MRRLRVGFGVGVWVPAAGVGAVQGEGLGPGEEIAGEHDDTRGRVVENSRQSQTRLNASNRAALLDSYAAELSVQEPTDRFGVYRSTDSE